MPPCQSLRADVETPTTGFIICSQDALQDHILCRLRVIMGDKQPPTVVPKLAIAPCRVVQAQEAIAEAHAEPETPTGMAIIRQVQSGRACL